MLELEARDGGNQGASTMMIGAGDMMDFLASAPEAVSGWWQTFMSRSTLALHQPDGDGRGHRARSMKNSSPNGVRLAG